MTPREKNRLWFANWRKENPELFKKYYKSYLKKYYNNPTNLLAHHARCRLQTVMKKIKFGMPLFRDDSRTAWQKPVIAHIRRQMYLEKIESEAIGTTHVFSHAISAKELAQYLLKKKVDKNKAITIIDDPANIILISKEERNEIDRLMFRDGAVKLLKKKYKEMEDFV
jgi:hypothetical protein